MVLYDALFVDGNTYTVSITTTEPGAPQSVTATDTTASQVTLGWSAPSSIGGSAITGYKYRYKASGAEAFGDWTAISNSASLTSHVVGGLEANTAYTFQMLATNDSGDGLYSGEVAASTLAGEAEQLAVTLVLDNDRISESDGVSTVTATLNRTLTAETTITVSASAVDPATGDDFTLSSNTVLTIAAGATTSTGTVTITAANNDDDDDNRQVTVSGTVANTAGVTAPADVTLTITDDESASTKVTLTVSPTSVAEDATGSDRTVTVTAELDGDPLPQATEVTVSVSGGNAVAGTDYTAVPEFTFTIAPGETSGTGTFTLAPVDDNLDETHETVTVTGTTNTGLSVEPASGLTVTIEDNDDPFVSMVNGDGSVTLYAGTLTIGATAISTDSLGFRRIQGVLEGTLSPETFTYGGDSFRITRLLTDSGGGSDSAHGELSLGDLLSQSLNTAESLAHWVLHLDSHTLAFADADDKRIGGSFIEWYGVTNASLGWSSGQQVAVKIVRPPTRVTLVLEPGVISEDGGLGTVTATLDKTSTAATTITVSASAVDPAKASDFTLSSDTTLTIAAGATTSTGTVTITAANNDDDDNRQVTVSGAVVNTAGVTAPADVTLTIFDDESASTKVTLTVSPTSVAEDAAGSDRTVTVTAELDGDPLPQATEVTVSVSGGTAVAGTDYAEVSDFTFTIDAGKTTGTGTFTLAPVDDNLEEPDKTVTVTATTASGLTMEPASGLTVTIEDDDAPAVTLFLDRNRISENDGVSTVTATLNQTMSAETTVTVSASAVSPAMDSAFTLSSDQTLTIAAGQRTSTGTVTITAVNNTADDDNREVTVSGTVVNADGVLAPEDVTLTIFDDESVSTKVTLTVSPTSVAEDATGSDRTVTVTAELDGDALPQATRVRVSVSGDTARPGPDYHHTANFTVTIAADQTSGTGTFTLAPVDDNVDEPDETVVLTGRNTTSDLPVEPVSGVTLTIEDNDPTAVRLVLTQRSIGEYGGLTTVIATLGRALTEEVSIAVSGTAVFPGTASDFAVSTSNVLTIAPGDTTSTGTVTITANNNNDVAADDKSVTVSGVATSVEDVTQPRDLTLTIVDDDARGMSYVPSTGVQSTATWWEPQSSEGRGTLKSRDVAQSFRTGPCDKGYHLALVSIKFRTASGGDNDRLMLTLHRPGLDGKPAESIGSNGTLRHASGMVDTTTFEDGTQMTSSMFAPPANNPRLEPNRTYFFKLHDPHMSGDDEAVSTASVSFTASDREATTMHDHGWSIGDDSFIAARSTSGWSKIGHSVRMWIGFNPVDRSCKGKRATGGGGSEANTLPELSVTNAAATESGDGTTRAMTFAVSVEPAPSETVTVSYETEDGTATGGAACPVTPGDGGLDYVSTSGTLTFGPEETSKDVTVTVCDDAVEDTGEEFALVLRSTQLMAVGEETLEVRGGGRHLECGDDNGGFDCRGLGLCGGRGRSGIHAEARRGCAGGADGAGVGRRGRGDAGNGRCRRA